MNWTTFHTAVQAWVATASGITTIWTHQTAPRPAYPYMTLHVEGSEAKGRDELRQVYDSHAGAGEELTPTVWGNRQVQVQVQSITGTETSEDFKYMDYVRESIRKPSASEALRTAGVGIVSMGPVSNFHELVNGRWVCRALSTVDFLVGISTTDTKSGYFNKTLVTSDFEDAVNKAKLDFTNKSFGA